MEKREKKLFISITLNQGASTTTLSPKRMFEREEIQKVFVLKYLKK